MPRGGPSPGADLVGGEPSPGADLGTGGRGYRRKRSVLRHCRHPHVTRVHRWRSLLQPTACGAAFSPGADLGGMSQTLVQMRAGVRPVTVQMVTKRDGASPYQIPVHVREEWNSPGAVHGTHRRTMTIHRSDAVHARSWVVTGAFSVLTSIMQYTNAAATYYSAFGVLAAPMQCTHERAKHSQAHSEYPPHRRALPKQPSMHKRAISIQRSDTVHARS